MSAFQCILRERHTICVITWDEGRYEITALFWGNFLYEERHFTSSMKGVELVLVLMKGVESALKVNAHGSLFAFLFMAV